MDQVRILVIEDDDAVGEFLLSCLSAEGYLVTVVQTGEDGLQQLEENRPAAVVLDLKLPGMNGLDVCRTMRSDPWMSKIPVLMLTGKVEEDDVVVGFEVGADDYITKPCSPKVLTARVKALLRRGPVPEPTKKITSTIKDEPDTLIIKTLGRCEIWVGDRGFPWAEEFSPTQRQLMALLVGSASGKIYQDEVQAALWPDSSTARARSSFDSLVTRLRQTLNRTLEPFDSKPYLIVKRGYLCLEHYRVDALEFIRLTQKGRKEVTMGELWPAELSFSAAFGFWQGTFMPANFGGDAAVNFQDELEQIYIESSLTYARVLAEKGRYPQAIKILRDARRFGPSNDEVVRLLHRLYMAQEDPGQAAEVLKRYQDSLARERYSLREVKGILNSFPKKTVKKGWLNRK